MWQGSPLGMVVLALVPVSAFLGIRTRRRRIALLRLNPKKVVQRRARPTQRIVWGHEVIVHERIHKYSLLHDLAVLSVLLTQISVIVIADNDAIILGGQLQDVPVVIANHSLATDVAGGGENKQSFSFQFRQDVLVTDRVVGSRCLLPPLGYKDRDGLMASGLEPVHANLDATAGEDLLISVTETKFTG